MRKLRIYRHAPCTIGSDGTTCNGWMVVSGDWEVMTGGWTRVGALRNHWRHLRDNRRWKRRSAAN